MSKSTATSTSRLPSKSAWAKGPPLSTSQNSKNPDPLISNQTSSTKSAWSRGPPTFIADDATTQSDQPTPSSSTNTPTPAVQPSSSFKLAWTETLASRKFYSTPVAIDSTVITVPAASGRTRRVVNWGTIEAVQQDLDKLTLPPKRSSQDVGTASFLDSAAKENSARYRPPSLQQSANGSITRLPAKSAWLKGPPPTTTHERAAPQRLDVPLGQPLPASSPKQIIAPNIRSTTSTGIGSHGAMPSFTSHTRSSSLSKPARLEIHRMFQTQGVPSSTSAPLALNQSSAPHPSNGLMNSNQFWSYSPAAVVHDATHISQLPATPSQRDSLDIRKLFQSSPSPASSSLTSSSSSQYSFPRSNSLFSPSSALPESPATSFHSSESLLLPTTSAAAEQMPAHHAPQPFRDRHLLRSIPDGRDRYPSYPPSPSNMQFINGPLSSQQIPSPLVRVAPSQPQYYPYQVPTPLTREGSSRSSMNFDSSPVAGPIGNNTGSPTLVRSIDDLDGDPTLPMYESLSITRERPSSGYYDPQSVINLPPSQNPYSAPSSSWLAAVFATAREQEEHLAELQAINFRLHAAFRDEAEYRRLLSVSGPQAQSLLDTFQTLLDTCQLDGETRRNLIVATRRLSTKTDLYPRSFDLNGVQFNSRSPFASGSFADIHMGQLHGETVCLKVIRVYQSSVYRHIVKTTAREAILWGQLSHPNLLPFYGLHRIGSQLALVSPWADNGRIGDFLREHPEADRVLLVSDMVEGLAYLHANDVVHGDLKGANVLVDKVGRAYLADFGLSAVTDPQILQWTSNSSAASRGGTVRYQAPELNVPESIEGEGSESGSAAVHIHNTTASDIYALSCVCYEVLTGRLPFFEFAREHTVMVNVGAGVRPSRPATFIEQWKEWGLSDGMWDLLTDCWKHQPSERPPIDEVAFLVSLMKPADTRPMSDWTDAAIRLRSPSAHPHHQPLSLEELENILV